MSNIAGHFTELLISKTKWSAAGEWGQCDASVSANSHVFKRLRKKRSDGASLRAGRKLFQARAAATGNAYSVYLTCSKKLTGNQLSLPDGMNKKLKCETKNKMMSVIGPVQSRYHEGSPVGKRSRRWEEFVENVGFEPGVKEWWSDGWKQLSAKDYRLIMQLLLGRIC